MNNAPVRGATASRILFVAALLESPHAHASSGPLGMLGTACGVLVLTFAAVHVLVVRKSSWRKLVAMLSLVAGAASWWYTSSIVQIGAARSSVDFASFVSVFLSVAVALVALHEFRGNDN